MELLDFCGFSFNGRHSSDLGIVRVSEGSRYGETLISNFQDRTVAIPGGDGTYFFESNYTNRTFTINIAFDGLTELQLRQLRQIFNGKDVGDLIFDEVPYKAYVVKVQSPIQLKYICFDNEVDISSTSSVGYINANGVIQYVNRDVTNLGRVYKGEGTIQFISYKPYAHSVYKYLNSYTNANKNEWKNSTGMLSTQGAYDVIGDNTTTVKVYNPGDVETDFCAYVPIGAGSNITKIELKSESNAILNGLYFSNVSLISNNDSLLRINSKSNLVEGCTTDYIESQDSSFLPEKVYYESAGEGMYTKTSDTTKNPQKTYYERIYITTGNLYNKFISSGDFFKIPIGTFNLVVTGTKFIDLDYSYLYY